MILYELLTARVPFHAASPIETMHLAQHQDPVPPRQLQPDLPRDLETICLKCLEKQPGKRYASADALADDLRRYLDDQPIQARRMTEIEKLARGCRRNPLVAASLAGVVGIFLVAFVLVSWSYWRVDAAMQQEAQQRQEAERKEKAERWERYRANIVATASALQVHNVGAARGTLEDAPVRHRNWEWRHFHSRLDLAQHFLRADDTVINWGAVTPNGARAMLYADNGFVRVWDTTARTEVQTLHNVPHVAHAVLSPDGTLLAYFNDEHAIILREIDTGRVRATLGGHDGNINSMQFSADTSRFVSCSADSKVRIWDTATGQSLHVFRPYETGIESIVIDPKARLAVIVDRDRTTIGLWDLDTSSMIASLPGVERGLHAVGFNRLSDRFVTIERFPSYELRLWNAATGQLIGVMGSHNAVTKLAFSADGTRIASASMDQTVRLWDGATGKSLAVLKGHNGRVTKVAFSPSSKELVSASEDHTLRLWDAAAGEPLAVLNGHTAAVIAAAYSTDGNRIVSASPDGSIRLWDVQTVASYGVLRGHTSFAYSVAFHPDGERIASASWDGTVRIWNATTGKQTMTLDHGDGKIVTAVAIHPAGRLLASRARGSLSLWDIASGQEVQRWDAPSNAWKDTRVAFSPDGNLLASACDGRVVKLWDVNSRTEVAALYGHCDQIRDLTFSPDGKWLATAGETYDKTVRIWDVAAKQPIQVLEGHKNTVYCVAFSPDGKLVASGSNDGTARLWDTATWREIAVLKHGANVYGVTFNPDGTRLACACSDNSIRFWDTTTHQSVAELRGHTDYVHALAFSPDGTRLVSASGDFTVRIWDTVRPQDRARGQ